MIELILSEKAYLWRKRMKFTQAEAAEYCDILPPYKWKHLEYGKHFPENIGNFASIQADNNEKFIIVRRRLKLNQTQAAKKIGISRQYLNMIENGKVNNYDFNMMLSAING